MTIKILVGDDEPDVEWIFKQRFRRRIRKGELEFLFAQDGRAALEVLRTHPEVHLVFTDLKMPVMDGLALLRDPGNETGIFGGAGPVCLWRYGQYPIRYEPGCL